MSLLALTVCGDGVRSADYEGCCHSDVTSLRRANSPGYGCVETVGVTCD